MGYICPYCFERNSKISFKCINKRCTGKGDYVFPGGLGSAKNMKAACPSCGNTSFTVVCPICKNVLPESTLGGNDHIISIVGSRSTGKSHFIGVIIHELINRISAEMGGSFEGFSDSMARYHAIYEMKLYQTRQVLEQTRAALGNEDNLKPLIFKFNVTDSFFRGKIKSYTFVFFDTAGEDLDDISTMSTVNKYIARSDGIIFLLDPMQITGVVSGLLNTEGISNDWIDRASGGVGIGSNATADDIMTRVSQLVRNLNGWKSTKKITIPVAAVFAKYDAFEPIVPDGFVVREPSPHCKEGKFNDSDRNNVNSEIKSMLETWGATAFTSQLEQNYTTYSYFACSALGLNNNPVGGRFSSPHPHRIEDPMLWLMKMNSIIK